MRVGATDHSSPPRRAAVEAAVVVQIEVAILGIRVVEGFGIACLAAAGVVDQSLTLALTERSRTGAAADVVEAGLPREVAATAAAVAPGRAAAVASAGVCLVGERATATGPAAGHAPD